MGYIPPILRQGSNEVIIDLERLTLRADERKTLSEQSSIKESYLENNVSKIVFIIYIENIESFIWWKLDMDIKPAVELSPNKIAVQGITSHSLP